MLGYDIDPQGSRLVVNEPEAARVREIFNLYEAYRSVSAVQLELKKRDLTTKSWTTKAGRRREGRSFGKPTLLRLLTNAVYSGRIEHKGVFYAGEHPAIIESDVWERVNAELRGTRRTAKSLATVPQVALLKGVLYCGTCNLPMMPTYTSKGDRRFRYYVCRSAKNNTCPTKSVAARLIEGSVVDQVRLALGSETARAELNVTEAEWRTFGENHPEFICSIVRRVVYEGVTGAVSLELAR
jgi:site-specific DNA recombinase